VGPLAGDFFKQAQAAVEAGEYARGLELVEKTLELGFDRWDVQWFKGRALEGLGRYAHAEGPYKRAQTWSRDTSTYAVSRAKNLVTNLQRYSEAEACLRMTLQKLNAIQKGFAVFAPVYGWMGEVMGYHLGRFEDALPYFEHAGEKYDEKAADAPRLVASYAYVLAALGRDAEACMQARAASEQWPTDRAHMPRILFTLYVLSETAQQPRYLSRLRRALETPAPAEWRFDALLTRASERSHPELTWLARLGEVVNGSAPMSTLDAWPAWRDAVFTAR
jgi:tetratricopeptide (TPR) repeat protein